MKVDLHIHTEYSKDSILPFRVVKKICTKKGIRKIGITDHDTLAGALKLKKDPDVIVGEEIKTDKGEVIGLFLQEEIKPGPLYDVIDKIKEQDGLVYIPHPFDRLRKAAIKDPSFVRYADIVEVFNARTLFMEDNKKSEKIARRTHLLMASGSDAHTRFEIGNAYVRMEPFNSKKEFIKNLKKAELWGKSSPVFVHAITKFLKWVK
jgi:hypothetical protein